MTHALHARPRPALLQAHGSCLYDATHVTSSRGCVYRWSSTCEWLVHMFLTACMFCVEMCILIYGTGVLSDLYAATGHDAPSWLIWC